ncbi:MAG: hypothetical protein ACREX8_01670, partial [Gammaproteobacteria bacterium]
GTAAEVGAAGEILVLDAERARFSTGEDRPPGGALFVVDPASGERALVSDFGDPNLGPVGFFPTGLAQESAGTVLVVDVGRGARGALFRVDLESGERTIVSDFRDDSQGRVVRTPVALALEPGGTVLVADEGVGKGPKGALFRVDLGNGRRTVVTDFADAQVGGVPGGVVLEASGTVLVVDRGGGTDFRGALLRVDPVSGRRTTVSNFGNAAQGVLGRGPTGLAVEPDGKVLAIDPPDERVIKMLAIDPSDDPNTLFRVDPNTGSRALVSDFRNDSQGAMGEHPQGVALEPDGSILVIDPGLQEASVALQDAFIGALFRIDRVSGVRTLLSDFGDPDQGPTSEDPVALAVLRGGEDPPEDPPAAPPATPPLVPPAVPSCFGRIPTIVGDEGNNVLTGSPGPDVFWGGGGADLIDGKGGDDRICGGPGRDVLKGGKGRDRLDGGPGFDVVLGGTGRDRCRAGERKTSC